jgi:hypothetical protein
MLGQRKERDSNPLHGRNQQFSHREAGSPVAPILAQAGWAAVGTRSGINQRRRCSTELFFAYLGLLLNLRSHQSFLLARSHTKSSHLAAPSSSVYLPNAAVKASANLFLSIKRNSQSVYLPNAAVKASANLFLSIKRNSQYVGPTIRQTAVP